MCVSNLMRFGVKRVLEEACDVFIVKASYANSLQPVTVRDIRYNSSQFRIVDLDETHM